MKRALVLCFLASFAAGMLVSVSPVAGGVMMIDAPDGPRWVWELTEMQELNAVLGTLQDQNKTLRGQLQQSEARYKLLVNQCI